ncbi:putative DNA polymerase beta/AP endonuclease [Yalta virus]|nr:putative DNA polymerase beta/AP endonuclease [Yalta virus]
MLLGISCNYTDALRESQKYNVLQINIGELAEPKYPEDEILNNIPDFDIPIFIHSKLCYNISKKNINYPIKNEMNVLKKQRFGKGIVIHLSKWYKSTRDSSLQDVVDKLNILLTKYDANIILETSYNINSLGSISSDFEYILKHIRSPNLNICLDTSHLYLTGHPINRPEYILEYFTDLELKIGLDRISLVHMNDIQSLIFGKHTEHLDIGKGFVFQNELVLNYFVSFCRCYDVPIIFERNKFTDASIKNEISKIEEVQKRLIFDTREKFDIFLKNSLSLHFINRLIEYLTTMNMDVSNVLELKHKIYNSYKGNKFKLLKTSTGYQYNFDFEYSDLFYKMMNERDYTVFDKMFNNPKYMNIKELLNITSIGPETVKKLMENGIFSLDQLKNEPLSIRKKLLTPFQQKIITNHKFIRLIDFDFANEIVKLIYKSYIEKNIHVYGSYFRIKNGIEEPRLIKDIDVLCVCNPNNFISVLKSIFNLKIELYMGNERKSFVFMYKKGYFTLEIYVCTPEEEPFMSLYLKGPVQQVKRIYAIAKAKGYKMNNKGITKNGEKIILSSEKEILELLNIKPIISR